MWMCISICESAFRLVTNHLYISSDFCSKQCHKPYTFLQIRNMTASQYNPWFEFQSWMKVKVVKWCRKKKKWNEHNLMHIYHKQCEIMQKNQWNSSKANFTDFPLTDGAAVEQKCLCKWLQEIDWKRKSISVHQPARNERFLKVLNQFKA